MKNPFKVNIEFLKNFLRFFLSVLLNVSISIVLFMSMFFVYNYFEQIILQNYLKMSTMFVQGYELSWVHEQLKKENVSKIEIYNSKEYSTLKEKLKKLANYSTIPIYWSYILYPGLTSEEIDSIASKNSIAWRTSLPSDFPDTKWIVISVVTVPFDIYNPDKTLPGVIFDYSPYPEFTQVLDEGHEFTVSSISYDYTYNFITKTYLQKIIDIHTGEVLGVLGINLPPEYLFNQIFFLLALTLIGIFLFKFFNII